MADSPKTPDELKRDAAPELYEALKRLMADLPSRRDWFDPVAEAMARAALAKAQGEAVPRG